MPPKPILAIALLLAVAGCQASGRAGSDNLPGVPVFPGATLSESVIAADRDPTEYYLVTDATEQEIREWYREEMPRAGWAASTDPDESFVIYHTVEGCYGFVGVFPNPDGTVELQLSRQAPGTVCEPYVTAEAGDE